MDEKKAKRSGINNAFYDTLGKKWHEGCDHPVAILRSENNLRNPWIAQVIDEKFKKSVKVLDIGCGAGFLTNFLAEKAHSVHGIDQSEESLKLAKEKDITESVQYKTASAESLPYPDKSFEVVSAMDLLEHVENPALVIKEAARVLKNDGLFFFHTFNRNFLSWLIVIKGVEWFVRHTPKNMHVYNLFIKPAEMKDMCFANHLLVESFLGVRPDIKCMAFWKMLMTGKVYEEFRFTFTPSLKTGYSGFATKMPQTSRQWP